MPPFPGPSEAQRSYEELSALCSEQDNFSASRRLLMTVGTLLCPQPLPHVPNPIFMSPNPVPVSPFLAASMSPTPSLCPQPCPHVPHPIPTSPTPSPRSQPHVPNSVPMSPSPRPHIPHPIPVSPTPYPQPHPTGAPVLFVVPWVVVRYLYENEGGVSTSPPPPPFLSHTGDAAVPPRRCWGHR